MMKEVESEMKMFCFYKIVYKNIKKLLFKQIFVSPPFPVEDGD